MIEISAAGIEKYQSILQGMGANGEKALRAALSRGSQTARAEATRQLKKRYVIKAGDIRSSGKVFFKAPGAGGLIGELKFAGNRIPLYKFDVDPKTPAGINGFKSIVKGHGRTDTSPAAFENAFIAKMKSGHIGVFERETDKALPIRQVMGLSVPEMVGSYESRETILDKATETIEKRLEHEIARIIGI